MNSKKKYKEEVEWLNRKCMKYLFLFLIEKKIKNANILVSREKDHHKMD